MQQYQLTRFRLKHICDEAVYLVHPSFHAGHMQLLQIFVLLFRFLYLKIQFFLTCILSHIRHFNEKARGINSKNSQVRFGRATIETGETQFCKKISLECGIVWVCGLKNDANIPWQETFAKHMPAFSRNDIAFDGKNSRRHCANFTLVH
jgi:hypothetical protein